MFTRAIIVLIFLQICAVQTFGQSPIQNLVDKKLTARQERAKLTADSLRLIRKADSLQERFDRLQSKLNFSTDSIPLMERADSLKNKFDSLQQKINASTGSISSKINLPADSLSKKLALAKKKWQSKLDSLKQGGAATEVKRYQQKLDSLERFPQQQYAKLMAAQEKLKDTILKNPRKLQDSLNAVQDKVKGKLAEVNKIADKVGVSGLGKDVNTGIPGNLNSNQLGNLGTAGLPQMANVTNPLNGSIGLPAIANPTIPAGQTPTLPTAQTAIGGLPSFSTEIGQVADVTKQIGDVGKQTSELTSEVNNIKENGLENSKKIPELLEEQSKNVKELRELEREKAAFEKEMKMQKELIEKYKNEQAIKEDMEEKVKEMANDKITEYQAKVDAPIRDLNKYKRKFSDVQDLRNLPKRAPNPLKGLDWRERLVPGFTLQTIVKTKTWLEFAPQFYYKLNGSWSVGAGWVYRFSMDANKLTFDDFGNLNGQTIFLQYHAFKGIFLRAEGEHSIWKGWAPIADRDENRSRFTTALGVGKSFSFSEKLKGNIQTLYHYTWQSPDPYPSLIEIRFGLDFSIKKKKQEAWKAKLKELRKSTK
jgi:hypothetical protein